jgi:glycine/D-amino acid oxidase-like deaminating enzyme
MYADSQTNALEFVRKQVKELSIDCQLLNSDSYIFSANEEERNKIIKEYEVAKELGIDANFIENSDFPPGNNGLLCFKNQSVFHPVRYVYALAKAAVSNGATIYCDTKAIKVEDGEIKTVICENELVIKAKHLVMATQYPIYDGPNVFYTRLFAKRSYGIAVDAKKEWPEGNYINVGKPTRSIRSHVECDRPRLYIRLAALP